MLKKRRIEKHLTQEELAEKIVKTKGYINKLENHPERCNPNVKLILKLSKELDIDPIEIFSFFAENRKEHDN